MDYPSNKSVYSNLGGFRLSGSSLLKCGGFFIIYNKNIWEIYNCKNDNLTSQTKNTYIFAIFKKYLFKP